MLFAINFYYNLILLINFIRLSMYAENVTTSQIIVCANFECSNLNIRMTYEYKTYDVYLNIIYCTMIVYTIYT